MTGFSSAIRPASTTRRSRVMARLDELAMLSSDGAALTRLYLTPEHKAATLKVMDWMEDAGMVALPRRRRQRGRPLRGRDTGRRDADPRLAYRHGARCRPLRRQFWRCRGDRGRGRASRPPRAPCRRHRDHRLRGRGGRALPGHAVGVACRRRHVRSSLARCDRRRGHDPARGAHGLRLRSARYRRDRTAQEQHPRLCRGAHRTGSGAGSRRGCRSASSPPSPAQAASRSRSRATPAMPARCRCACAATRWPPRPR